VPRDGWQPDLVVLNQGSNDADVDPAVFRAALARYLDEIRRAYPAARIVVLRPLSGSQAQAFAAEVAARNQAGDARISLIDTTGWLAPEDFVDGLHPNLGGSAKLRDRLVPVLGPLL
jgi:lysophospholipase L1-like esterase